MGIQCWQEACNCSIHCLNPAACFHWISPPSVSIYPFTNPSILCTAYPVQGNFGLMYLNFKSVKLPQEAFGCAAFCLIQTILSWMDNVGMALKIMNLCIVELKLTLKPSPYHADTRAELLLKRDPYTEELSIYLKAHADIRKVQFRETYHCCCISHLPILRDRSSCPHKCHGKYRL